MRRRVAERIFGPRRVRRGLAQGAAARRREPHSYWLQGLPPAVVVTDEWCGRSYRRPGLPAAVARDNTTRRERLAKGSFAGARVRSAKATVLAEALGTLQSRRGPLSNSSIAWSTDTSWINPHTSGSKTLAIPVRLCSCSQRTVLGSLRINSPARLVYIKCCSRALRRKTEK